LPFEQMEASYIDARALALAPLFLTVGLLNIPVSTATGYPRLRAAAPYMAALLACINLTDLTAYFRRESAWLEQYRSVLPKLPEHALVLPVFTYQRMGSPYRDLHAGSFALLDRNALIPYLFSGDRGSPMKYFRYRSRPYAPEELWYHLRLDRDVDWA